MTLHGFDWKVIPKNFGQIDILVFIKNYDNFGFEFGPFYFDFPGQEQIVVELVAVRIYAL